jgi:hypothetical protein
MRTISGGVWSRHFSRTFRMHTQILFLRQIVMFRSGHFSEPFSTPCCRGCDRRTIIPKSVKLALILLSQDSFFQFSAVGPALRPREGASSDTNIDFFRLHRSSFSPRPTSDEGRPIRPRAAQAERHFFGYGRPQKQFGPGRPGRYWPRPTFVPAGPLFTKAISMGRS